MRKVWQVVVLTSVLLLVACNEDIGANETIFEEGKEDFKSGSYEAALDRFERAEQEGTTDALEEWKFVTEELLEAEELVTLKKYDQAEKIYDALLDDSYDALEEADRRRIDRTVEKALDALKEEKERANKEEKEEEQAKEAAPAPPTQQAAPTRQQILDHMESQVNWNEYYEAGVRILTNGLERNQSAGEVAVPFSHYFMDPIKSNYLTYYTNGDLCHPCDMEYFAGQFAGLNYVDYLTVQQGYVQVQYYADDYFYGRSNVTIDYRLDSDGRWKISNIQTW